MAQALSPQVQSRNGRAGDLGQVTGVILAGGLGTRLRSSIGERAKVLAPVGGRPFITHLLDRLADAGVRRTVLLTGYGAAEVRAALGGSYAGMALDYSPELHPLGTAGALRAGLAKFDTAGLLLLNGDSYCRTDLGELAELHRLREADLTMVLVHVGDAERFGTVHTTMDGTIVRFIEKGMARPGWINAGIYMIKRELVAEIPSGRAVSLEYEIIPRALTRKRLLGFKSSGPFVDIGTPESYAAATAFFQS